MTKELCVTSDFIDDLIHSGTLLTEDHIDNMMQYAASLGAVRFEWLVATLWNIYREPSPLKYDVLRVACDAAHRHGMRFDVVYKPFESGLGGPKMTLPPSFPSVAGDGSVRTESGVMHTVRRFVADNPQYRVARRKGDGEDPGGRLAEIRLVKSDPAPPEIDFDDISFWYSRTNGNFRKHEGPLETSLTKVWRLSFPYDDELSTALSFRGFDLPEDVKYFEIRCEKTRGHGTFSNQIERMVELVNERGEVIPSAPSTLNANPETIYERAKLLSDLGITDYLTRPEVRRLLESFDSFKEHFESNAKGMHIFEPQWEVFTLDRDGAGVLAVHRGKPMQHPATHHPIYPEVRRNWLDDIQYCIERDVDGVNIRISRHGGMNEPWAYGFNDPVMERLEDKEDVYEAAVVSGQAFDTFMLDAAELLHKSGKEIGVHLCGIILASPDKLMATTKPSNFVWNWEKWVREIVDYTEFHKTNFFRWRKATALVDHFGHVVRQAGKPLIYQSGQSGKVTHFEGPHRFLPFEMRWAKNHPHITCYNIYETASIFRLNQNDMYEGSPDIKQIVKDNWRDA